MGRLRAALRPPGFRDAWVEVGGWRIHHRVSAGGGAEGAPSLVLVHGLIVSGRYMMPLALRLAETHRVLVPDLPGFGASGKPRRALDVPALAAALAGYLEAAVPGPAVLVANSFGCQIAARTVAAGRGAVERMVMVGPTMDAAARTAPRQLARLVAAMPRERFEYPALLAADLARAGVARGFRTFRFALADRIEESLPRVAVPTLVVRGDRDPIVPRRWAERVADLLPDGRLVEIAGGGHALNYGRADDLAAVVLDFLDRP